MFDYAEDNLSSIIAIIILLAGAIVVILPIYLTNTSIQYNKKLTAVINECKSHKVVKTYTANRDMEFYVTLDNAKTYEVDKKDYGKFIEGQYCK